MTEFFYIFTYYFTFSSAVLIYGIGLKQTAINAVSLLFVKKYAVKNLLTTLCASFVCRFILTALLLPLTIADLLPLFVILVVMSASFIFERLLNMEKQEAPGEMLISVLSVLLATSESSSFIQLFYIAFTCWLSVFASLVILYAINSRIQYASQIKSEEPPESVLIFLSIAFVLLILFGLNFSWLNVQILG